MYHLSNNKPLHYVVSNSKKIEIISIKPEALELQYDEHVQEERLNGFRIL